jgi:hypothetical protein
MTSLMASCVDIYLPLNIQGAKCVLDVLTHVHIHTWRLNVEG